MNYEQTLEYIHSIPKFIRPLGNAALGTLLSHLGNPHNGQKFIHIAGTNGKGSTAAITAAILADAGYKTGLFTSPYIERYNERIQINNVPIPDDALADTASRVRNCMESNNCSVSEFAFGAAVMFLYFKEQHCDYIVLEAGLGGRLDATNIIDKNEVCAITSISLDHTEYLGNTVGEIANEKCGIIKNNSSVVLYPIQDKTVFEAVKSACNEKSAQLSIAAEPVKLDDSLYKFPSAADMPLPDEIISSISLGGVFQPYNASVAIEIIRCLIKKGADISVQNITNGLNQVKWPVRFEKISERIIIDGGHNPDGIKKLVESLKEINGKINIVIAMMADKSVSECVYELCSICDTVTVTQLDMPRCMNAAELAAEFEKHGKTAKTVTNIKAAIATALQNNGTVCICGSLYLAGEARKICTQEL